MTLIGDDLTHALAHADHWEPHDDDRLWVNVGRLDALARHGLAVAHPIDLRFGPLDDLGTHTFTGNRHAIVIRTGLTADDAAATILHEIGHARQAERWGSVHAMRRLVGDDLVERDAEEIAQRLAHTHESLVRLVRGRA